MSEAKKYVMTYEGVKKLEEELEYLKTVKRKENNRKNKSSPFIWRFKRKFRI